MILLHVINRFLAPNPFLFKPYPLDRDKNAKNLKIKIEKFEVFKHPQEEMHPAGI